MFLMMNFHRWINFDRYIKRKNVCRNTLYFEIVGIPHERSFVAAQTFKSSPKLFRLKMHRMSCAKKVPDFMVE